MKRHVDSRMASYRQMAAAVPLCPTSTLRNLRAFRVP